MKTFQKITWAFFVLLALFIGGIALNSCSIQPTAWTPQSKPEFTGALQLNDHLSNSVKLDLKGWNGAEDFAYDQEGNLYCGVHRGETNFSEGAILQFTPQGQMRVFLHTSGWVTGMEFDQSGNLIALIQGTGLVKITPNRQIIPLVQKDAQNRPILMGSGLTIATDGKIYFANLSATHTTSPKYINKLILELEKTGGVYCYHPKTNTIQTLSEGNYFANGLVLSKSEDYLLLSETSKYRVLRYWLKGAKAGTWEVFMDNLAGFPNNITRRENGNFWLGFTTKRNDQLDEIHAKAGLKKFVYGLPNFIQPKAERFGMILEINEQGNVIQALYDTKGTTVMEAGSIIEKHDKLYIGGDVASYIAIYDL